MTHNTAPKALTHDEKKAADAAFAGRPFNDAWSASARAVYEGIVNALPKELVPAVPEIEAVLDTHPSVQQSQVVAIDGARGPLPVAWVVARNGARMMGRLERAGLGWEAADDAPGHSPSHRAWLERKEGGRLRVRPPPALPSRCSP